MNIPQRNGLREKEAEQGVISAVSMLENRRRGVHLTIELK
jgi:hypothetical protein